MRAVIRRTCDPEGGLNHLDEPSTYEAAEAVAGRRLDRRRNYALIEGQVCIQAEWSTHCSGCTEVPESTSAPDRGMGCDECGYTGRRRERMWLPHEALKEEQ